MKIIYENLVKNEQVILWGASGAGIKAANLVLESGFGTESLAFYDSDERKQGQQLLGIRTLSSKEFLNLDRATLVIITSSLHREISQTLESLGFTNYHYFHELVFQRKMSPKYPPEFVSEVMASGDRCNLDIDELYTIYASLIRTASVAGDIAEVGVYRGGSARFLYKFRAPDKSLFTFDTFEGLPPEAGDEEPNPGWLNDTSLGEVKAYVGEHNARYFQGVFPQSASELDDERFSLVHLDMDLKKGTFDALTFFLPRLAKSGRIIIHDYNSPGCPGVKEAVFGFFQGCDSKQSELVEIAETQLLILKHDCR